MLMVFDGNHYDGWSQFMTYHSPVGVIMTVVQHWLFPTTRVAILLRRQIFVEKKYFSKDRDTNHY